MDEVEIALDALHNSPPRAAPETPTEAETSDELDAALIEYITRSCRLLFAEHVDTWQNFHGASVRNAHKYADYSVNELRDRFEYLVLPRVYAFQLTETEKRLFDLLTLHPEYERIGAGYQRVAVAQRVASCRQPKVDQDLRVVTQLQSDAEMFALPPQDATQTAMRDELQLLSEPHPFPQTVVFTLPYEGQHAGHYFRFSKENAALLSAVLSNDFELAACAQLSPKEMHQRLREAKRNFEQCAHMPENCADAEALLAKLSRLKKLREAIIDVVARRF